MLKKFIIAFAGYAVLLLTLGAVKIAQINDLASMAQVVPPTAVTTTEAREVAWHPIINATGTLVPINGVMLASDADGPVMRVYVENGARVRKDDLILELDATVERQQLEGAVAAARQATINYDRMVALRKQNAVSDAELDESEAARDQAAARVAEIQAMIEKKMVRAPFDGRVGIRKVNQGNFVNRGQELISLQELSRMYVNFYIPQRQLPEVAIGQKVSLQVDAFAEPFVGEVSAINTEVDPATRNLLVQAIVDNPGEQLRAGMFGQVELELPAGPDRVVVPSTAVAYASYGNSVYIIEEMTDEAGETYLGARQQIVRLGEARGDLVVIESGVKAGEVVATSGVFKLRNGARVQVNNSAQPSEEAAPDPVNS